MRLPRETSASTRAPEAAGIHRARDQTATPSDAQILNSLSCPIHPHLRATSLSRVPRKDLHHPNLVGEKKIGKAITDPQQSVSEVVRHPGNVTGIGGTGDDIIHPRGIETATGSLRRRRRRTKIKGCHYLRYCPGSSVYCQLLNHSMVRGIVQIGWSAADSLQSQALSSAPRTFYRYSAMLSSPARQGSDPLLPLLDLAEDRHQTIALTRALIKAVEVGADGTRVGSTLHVFVLAYTALNASMLWIGDARTTVLCMYA